MRSPAAMLRCLRSGRALQRYLDGELDAASAARVVGHLGECGRCGTRALTFVALKDAVRSNGDGPDAPAIERLQRFGRTLRGDHGHRFDR